MNRIKGILTASLLLVPTMLAGCTQSPAAEQGADTTSAVSAINGSTEQQQEETNTSVNNDSTSVWPRTIIDAAGNTIELKEQPTRIAVLHPLYMDYFFALDTPPIASGSAAEAFEKFETMQPYAGTADVLDLGSGQALNTEKILEADPDVIVTFKGQVDTTYDELVKIAPVVQINYADTWEEAMRLAAKIIGKEDLAEQEIQATEDLIAQTKETIKPIQDKTFALLRVTNKGEFNAQGTKNTIYYNDTEGFGLKKPEGYPEEAEALSLEALSQMDPDYIIIQHDLSLAKAAVQEKESLEVWKSLKAVKEGHVLFFDNSLNSGSVLATRIAAKNLMTLVTQ